MSRPKHNDFADVLTAAMRSGSTAKFFDAIEVVDRKAGYAELMDSINTPPSTFALCRCGSQLVMADSRIRLTDGERQAAADALGGDLARVDIVVDAINTARADADRDYVADWNDSHLDCGINQ